MLVPFKLLRTGNENFESMLKAIEMARQSVRFEMYIFRDCALGVRFREALVQAQQRGVRVQVMIDAWGSITLSDSFWDPLVEVGGEYRRFNPLRANACLFRDHRKLVVVDQEVAFLGGCNVATEYEGDGLTCGWCDLGIQINGQMARELAKGFDQIFPRAEQPHLFVRFRKKRLQKRVHLPEGDIFLSGPGWGRNWFRQSLRRDLAVAKRVQIVSAYFLPSRRMRAELMKVARRGGNVQLILAGQSDVPLSQLASRSLYQRLLRSGIEIYEYGPQILHAKLFIIDNTVYMGSANLDTRSLQINYEIMVRMNHPQLAASARNRFSEFLAHSKRIEPRAWKTSRTYWNKFKERWAYFLLARVDPWFAQRQLRSLR